MSQTPLRVIARLQARPGKESELRSLLLGLVAPTHKEPGCLSYELLENREDPSEFTFVESWRDEPAFQAHFVTPHVKKALESLPVLMADDMNLRKYDAVK